MKRILITGANGYIGSQLAQHLALKEDTEVFGVDVKPMDQPSDYPVFQMDIRDPELVDLMAKHDITHVVHLASIVNPGQDEALEYDIDVNGTKNVLDACARADVKHISITSSGAAYGYYADNPEWITESDPLRGNDSFSYSRHKKMVEQLLAEFQASHDDIDLLILRPCTVIGSTTRNRITQLFDRSKLLAVGDSNSPFVFIWDQDVVAALVHGITGNKRGAFNLAGDGKLDVNDLARITGKHVQRLPVFLLKTALWLGKTLGLSEAGPEQLKFLQYRPVLSNQRLKDEFGYTPMKSSRQAFEVYWESRQSS